MRGDRGSGKTHLVQSLIARQDRKPQLIVRPSFFDPNLPFEEYLLAQLKTAMGEEDEFHGDRPLEVIARAITRRLLLQAIRSLNPVERLFALSLKSRPRFAMLRGGRDKPLATLDKLCETLTDPASGRELPTIVTRHGLTLDWALRLIEGHLKQHEKGVDLLLSIRCRLYQVMARSVLLDDNDGLASFLGGEYVQVGLPGKAARAELVSRLLHALVEASALVRMPIVFVFDNLERLLSPLNQYDPVLTNCFVRSLAQAVDTLKGILFLLFAEGGLFSAQVVPQMDEFNRGRWDQGVPLPGHGPIHLLDIKYPSVEEIGALIQSRMSKLIGDLSKQLPPEFPFSKMFLSDIVGTGSVNLRNVLYGLRDKYNLLVYGTDRAVDTGGKLVNGVIPATISTSPPSLSDWPRLVENAWNRALQATRRQIDAVSHQELHASLGALIEYVIPHECGVWTLHKVQPVVTVGENPDYGVLTVADWKARPELPSDYKGPKALHVAVGLLLAAGTGLRADLQAKFDYFEEHNRGHRLVILWDRDGEELIAKLPPGTRIVWDSNQTNHWRTDLRTVRELDLRHMLAFPRLLDYLREMSESSVPREIIREFIQDRCRRVLELVQPSEQYAIESKEIDEN